MSEISRRDAVRRLALVLASTGAIDGVGARMVHAMTAEAQTASGGAYAPKTFTETEFRLQRSGTGWVIVSVIAR